MQAGNQHMAVIIDEYGTTVGLATVEDLVEEVRDASYKAVRWSWLGAGNPGKKKKEGRHEDVERYGAFAIDLGLNDEMNTDLNMSI